MGIMSGRRSRQAQDKREELSEGQKKSAAKKGKGKGKAKAEPAPEPPEQPSEPAKGE